MIDNEIYIRDYHVSDIPSLTVLTNELGYPINSEQMSQRMGIILDLEDYWTYVAVLDQEVVAYTGFHKNYFWEREGFYIKVQVFVVKKEFRRSGVGKKLMGFLENFSRQLGAKSIVLNSGKRAERESAHQFYPSLGFEGRSIGYTKTLE